MVKKHLFINFLTVSKAQHALQTHVYIVFFFVASKALILDNNCGEAAAKVCYGAPGGTAQNIDLADLSYTAAYLRYYGQSTIPASFLSIPATTSFACAE